MKAKRSEIESRSDRRDEASLILVVDDEELTKRLYKLYFRGNKEWGFSFAPNGKVALKKINKTSFKVLITDICMPEMDGIELLKALKDSDKKITSIVVTAYGNSFQEELADIGNCKILCKPIDFPTLTVAIQQGLAQYNRLNDED